MPLNKVLFDSTIELHLDMERVAIESRATIVKLLQDLEKELIAKVSDGVSDWSKARIAKQLSEADAIIRQYYDDAAGIARDTTTSVAQVSASATATSLSAAVGGQVAIGVLPTASYLETLAGNTIIQGAVQADWWERQAGDTQFKFQSAVRQGLVGAETTPQIVKRVRGVMDLSRRNAETLVHTSVQSVANTSRMKVFEDNSDVISEFEYSSSLDRKTCPTCGILDGKRWVNGTNKPVNHSMVYQIPPKHFRCRCSMVPVLKTWRELGINMDELPESTRASMDGQVTDKTFADWLKRKTETDPTFADRTLGKGRAELWRNGKITMDQMIQGGKPLSLAELNAKYGAPDSFWAKGTQQAPWHDASFANSPEWIKQVIKKNDDKCLGLHTVDLNDGAYYQSSKIHMKDYDINDPKRQATWRHEYGHFLDDNMSINKNRFRSNENDFINAVNSDAKAIKSKSGEGLSQASIKIKDAQDVRFNSIIDDIRSFSTTGEIDSYLTIKAKDIGVSLSDIEKFLTDETMLNDGLISSKLRIAQLIDAVKNKNILGFSDSIKTGWPSVDHVLESKGSAIFFSDLVGSATRNEFLGVDKGWGGHSNDYYKSYSGAAETEVFANLTALYGNDNPFFHKIIEVFLPKTTTLFKGII